MPLCHYFLIFPENELPYNTELAEFYQNVTVDYYSLYVVWPEDRRLADAGSQISQALMDFWKKNKDKQIIIPDWDVLENIDAFRKVQTLCNGFIPFRGLDYYGKTIIEHSELPAFISLLEKLSAGDSERFCALIKLAQEAIAQNAHLLHIGI